MFHRSLAILAAIGLVPAALAPAAAQTLEITVVGAPPPAVTFVGTFKDRVVPAIDKRLAESGKGFRIEWTHAYAFTLAKFNEVFETVEEGIAGAGLILKNFEPSNLPLEAYAVHMPFSGITREQIAAIDARLRETVPELNQAYEKHNQVFIASGVNDSMHLFTKFPVTKVEDLRNRKLGSSGTFAQWLRGTGAVTVDSSMNQSYTNIKNGVYEGYPIGVILSFVYKTYSAAPYFTRVDFGPTITSGITFNSDTWKKIPAHAQRIVREEAAKWVGLPERARRQEAHEVPRHHEEEGRQVFRTARGGAQEMGRHHAQHRQGVGATPREARPSGQQADEGLYGRAARPQDRSRPSLGSQLAGAPVTGARRGDAPDGK